MFDPRYTTVITGVAGQLGLRLLPQLHEFSVYGIDLNLPLTDYPIRFEVIDVGRETCCRHLVQLLRESEASSVVHLASVNDLPDPNGRDLQRMWQVNVAGTARVMEAITEANQTGCAVRKFIFASSALVYGSDLRFPVKEDAEFSAHSLPWVAHKQEADEVVHLRAGTMGACTTYVLRPHAYTGTASDSYVTRAVRGIPTGTGRLAERWRQAGKRLPLMVPRGEPSLDNRFQFVHIDDVARLIAWILRKPERTLSLQVLNVAGRGPALPLYRCAEIAGNRTVQMRSRSLCRWILRLARRLGLTSLSPEALPYIFGSCTTDNTRLHAFLGSDYDRVIQYTSEQAFAASFGTPVEDPVQEVHDSLTAD